MMRLAPVLALAVVLGSASPAAAQDSARPPAAPAADAVEHSPRRTFEWTDEIRDLAGHIAIQDGGRVKPLSTFARFFVLGLSGGTTLTLPDADGDGKPEKMAPIDFVLDSLFFQDQAVEYPVLIVEDYDVLDAIGLGRIEGKRKRDRYSYQQLAPALDALFAQARQIQQVPHKQRTALQKQIFNLAMNVDAFVAWMSWQTLTVFPPSATEDTWLAPYAVRGRVDRGESLPEATRALDHLRELLHARDTAPAFAGALRTLQSELVAAARARGEYDKVPLEITYYRANFFFYARWLFALAFVVCALVFLAPRSRVLQWTGRSLLSGAWALLCVGITIRCIVRERPPVSTLYETILFITATMLLAAFVVEWFHRRSIAQLLAAKLGYVGLSLADWYEEISGVDTMPQLQAVLDTNFWLSTHVTSVTIGYAAGLLASAISIVWVLARATTLLRGPGARAPEWAATLTRGAYGVLCFGVLFSTIGTILGGIWANESWGRFWGWDPKENGALMIVLGILVILHARMCGLVRERGLHVLSILLGCIVVFSWFHTNQLGVGLHAYGFDERLGRMISWTYRTLVGVAALGAIVGYVETNRERRATVGSVTAETIGA